MSLNLVADNGEFLLENEVTLCTESVHGKKIRPERGDAWLAYQIPENQDRADIFRQIGGSIYWMLETGDDNLAKCMRQFMLSITQLTKSFRTFYPLL